MKKLTLNKPTYINYDSFCKECEKEGKEYTSTAGYSTRTAAYYPPIYKNGVNINPDLNTTTTNWECSNGHKWQTTK